MLKVIKQDGTVVCDNQLDIEGLNISDKGHGNIIEIHLPVRFVNCRINIVGNDNYVFIDSSRFDINNLYINLAMPSNNRKVSIGSDLFCGGCSITLPDDYNEVSIGNDCLFSDTINIRTEDGHTIYDIFTGECLNKSTSGVKIGNHVWIARNVFIGKNISIASNVVIGAGSIVVKNITDSYCSYAGNPAKKIKENINWNRARIPLYNKNKNAKKIVAVIPARYDSSRFPGKPLAKICGKPMIQWVYEKVSKVEEISQTIVATDDKRIYDAVLSFGGEAVMTGKCSCGSERVYEAIKGVNCDIVLNIQGDEPLIKTEMIKLLISAFNNTNVEMATLKKQLINHTDIEDPNIAKIVTDINDYAITFSRAMIPFNRDGKEGIKYYKHIGVYGYTKKFLQKFVSLPQSSIEKAEQLEQMRAIENGYKIKVLETNFDSVGVDLPGHISKVEAIMNEELK